MTNGQGTPKALIYNRKRTFNAEVPLEWVEPYFEDEEMKIYVRGYVGGKDGKQLIISRKLDEQDF